MFPKGMINDIVVSVSPLQLDGQHSPGEIAIIWASVATKLAWIPFEGPVWWVRMGHLDGSLLANMTEQEAENALMDLHLAGTKDTINMVEAWGDETPMDIIKQWMREWQEAIKEIVEIQEEFLAQCTIREQTITTNNPPQAMIDAVKEVISHERLDVLKEVEDKNHRERTYKSFENEIFEKFEEHIEDWSNERQEGHVREVFFQIVKERIRHNILEKKTRVDWRDLDQIRPIHCEIDTVPNAHGTALFWRGDTQVLSILTLGSPGDAEIKDDMEHDQEASRWFHHYKMPPFSNNEARMVFNVKRREVWHGRLAEKAIEAVLPDEKEFPYTMRVVSEVLGSWGSTSMASVCGTTLAMYAGWVPLKKPVSGIAMWMVSDGTQEIILTDIKWTEDFTGDMDFKLAWTDEGMTAIQMDTKLTGVSVAKLEEMLDKAQAWRSAILEYMLQTIDTPRKTLKDNAPALLQFSVKPKQVREIIWPGWSTIQNIIQETDVKIDLEDDGSWVITATDQASAKKALEMVKAVIWSPEIWETIDGKITRVEPYWVFVSIGNNTVWLCHVKQLGQGYIEDVSALYSVWDSLTVTVTKIDNDWKIALKNASSDENSSTDENSKK